VSAPASDLELLRREIQRKLALIDGASFHHGVMFHATTGTQELARMQTAQRLALMTDVKREQYLEAAQLFRNGETECSWCLHSITDLHAVVTIGDRLVHTGDCQNEFNAFASDAPATKVSA
jgi:hypothetical protein